MAKVEVDEGELRDYMSLRKVVESINKHPKGGMLLEEAHKLVNPEAKTPRLDAAKEQHEPFDEMKKEIGELKKTIAERDAERDKNEKLTMLQAKVDAGKAKLREEGWQPDGLKMLDEFREQEGILDPIAAAAYYEKLHGSQVTPVVPSAHMGRWDFTELAEKDEGYAAKLLQSKGDNETLVMREAMKSLNDFRGQRR